MEKYACSRIAIMSIIGGFIGYIGYDIFGLIAISIAFIISDKEVARYFFLRRNFRIYIDGFHISFISITAAIAVSFYFTGGNETAYSFIGVVFRTEKQFLVMNAIIVPLAASICMLLRDRIVFGKRIIREEIRMMVKKITVKHGGFSRSNAIICLRSSIKNRSNMFVIFSVLFICLFAYGIDDMGWHKLHNVYINNVYVRNKFHKITRFISNNNFVFTIYMSVLANFLSLGFFFMIDNIIISIYASNVRRNYN